MGPTRARLGEGPRWDAAVRRLLWVDIEGGLLHAGDRTIDCRAMRRGRAYSGPPARRFGGPGV